MEKGFVAPGCIRTMSGEAASRNLLFRSELHSKASEEQMTQQGDKRPLAQAQDQSHKSAKHIEETGRLACSVETANDPSKVRRTKD
jgi:hypothetical protein